MRLIYTTEDADKGRTLANFLSSEGIDNQLEMTKNTDWGQSNYGTTLFRVWVIDEDTAETAERWAEAFKQDPKNPQFQKAGFRTTVIPSIVSSEEDKRAPSGFKTVKTASPPQPLRMITSGILMLCCLFYLINSLTTPTVASPPPNLPNTPIMAAPIYKQFLYDYPYAYVLVDKLVNLFGVERLNTPQDLPLEGKYLFKEAQNTPYWHGFYDKLLAYFQGVELPDANAPLFEKIREGEVWRLFTPCLMHADFLHILFNMLWLIILGKQLEERLNPRQYILLIVLIGIFSNTCQYLMGGPNFIGFSGVVCGLVAFIYVRQKIAPWEGYPLETSTSLFIVYFISALLLIQMVSFYLEANRHLSISPGIANTAHITGALFGALLGFLPLFKKSNKLSGPAK